MQRLLVGIAACAVLAGCGGSGEKKGDDGNSARAGAGGESAAVSSGTTAGQVDLRPGEWETTVETGAPDGMPPEVARMMKGTKITSRSCLTAEDVKRRQGEVFTGGKDSDCKQRNVTVSGGRVQGTMTCGGPEGQVETSIEGQFAADHYQMKSQTKTGGMTMTATISGRRVGDCPAGSSG